MATAVKPKAVTAFVFAGGLTWGIKKHFDVHCVLEETNYGVATAQRNMPEVPIHVGVENWPIDELRKHEWDFIAGNPPCAAWSQAGAATKKGRTYDSSPLVDCTRRHFNLLKQLHPKIWAWESVQRAWTVGEDFVRGLAREAADLGYSTTIFLHDVQYLGVPQSRKRVFIICHRVEGHLAKPSFDAVRTIEDALRGLNDPGEPLERNLGKVRWLLPHVRQGENLSAAYMRVSPPEKIVVGARGQIVGRPPFTIKRARSGQPAPVVMHELVHPVEHRGLSIKELAILCGYPPDYEFVGANDAGQVGRGVCPPVAEYLARNVAAAVRRNVPVTRPMFQVVDYTDPPSSSNGDDTVVSLRSRRPKLAPATLRVVQAEAPAFHRPLDLEGSGAFQRRLLASSALEHDQILGLVHAHYPGSKATIKDVKWNQYKLARDTGTKVAQVAEPDERQPQATRQGVDPGREFDTSSLRESGHSQWIHRDYLAHALRWAWAGRFVNGQTRVLDVGCGPDVPMINILTMPRNQVPRSYVGVDLNREPRKHQNRQWATFHWEFNFLERFAELGRFDLITNFEVIEHMRRADGLRLLAAMKACLEPDGTLLLSTPVFNGRAAANHIHEFQIDELREAIEASGLRVDRRHGTFASKPDVRKVATASEKALMDELEQFLSGEVMACLMASKYPDASRNNVWVLRHANT